LKQDIDLGNFQKFVTELKKKNPSVVPMLGVGGWTDSQNNKAKYKEMMSTSANRAKFAK
jgi:GH18 family chitinase